MTAVLSECMLSVAFATPDQSMTARFGAEGIVVILVFKATSLTSAVHCTSSVIELCDMMSVCKEATPALEMRLQFEMSRRVRLVNADGIEETFVPATMSDCRFWTVGVCSSSSP